ncbi:hypothetical protein Nepgr_028490 [Nepenthes gracilis]|uniref:Protein transport protein sec16 n=1 Tax=Nepenthes gracilis TaxID=150966 RepID=A0AAD3TC51_NEPGR|nr:hypothetical protein Nepgr_028490 [Nepenthes gracilis]
MASNPLLELEDHTDEDFFDKLVNEDDDGDADFKASDSRTRDFADDDSDEAKTFSNLSISEIGNGYADSGAKINENVDAKNWTVKEKGQPHGDGNDFLVWSNSFSLDCGGVTDEAENGHYDSEANKETGVDANRRERGLQREDHLAGEANGSLVSSSSFSFSNGIVLDEGFIESEVKSDLTNSKIGGSASSCVKEVQWSSFNESSVHGTNKFGSYSDFFADSGEAVVENLDNESKFISGNRASNVPLENSYSYKEYQGEHGSAAKQITDGQDLNSSQSVENLYAGWMYDPNSGQWYQLDGCDAMTNGQQNIDSTGEIVQGSFDASADSYPVTSIGKSLQVSDVQKTSQSAVGTVSYVQNVVSCNQASQVNSEYPANMIFDPQYPGWYYDTIAQEWGSLETYHSTTQSTIQAYDQQSQNGFASTATYIHGHDHSINEHELSSQGLKQNLATSLSDYSEQGTNVWQHQVLSESNDVADSIRNQMWENAYNFYSEKHVGEQKAFNSIGAVPSYEKSSQGYNTSSWATGLNSFIPNGSPVQQFSFTHTVETNGPLQYGSREPDNVFQPLVPNGHHHAPHAGRPSAGRPPHALVTFGFGGKLIVMKDNSSLGNSLHGNKDAESHSIAVVNLMEAVKDKVIASGVTTGNCNYFRALCHQSFPGPLVGGNVGNKELQKWIDESISDCESPYVDYRKGEVLKLLLSLLRIACQHYGKLRSLGTDTSLRENELPESAVANLFASSKRTRVNFSQYDSSTKCLMNLPSEAQIQKTASEVQSLLITGRKKEALQLAEEGQLWGFALILAHELGEQFYVNTVKKMATSHLVAGLPLRTLCLLIAKKPEDVFSTNIVGGFGLPGSVHMSPQTVQQFVGYNMLDNWEENLAVITANRTENDHLVITHLGDSLWKDRNDIAAAHICYLVAEADFELYSDSARLCLAGGDHWNFPRTYASPAAIQRTELFEYSKVLGNSQYVLLPFQPYKLIYAHMLAEVGKVSDSLKYCQVLQKSLKAGRSPEVDTLKQLVVSLEERLKTHQQVGYAVNLAPAKIVGKFLHFIDSTAHRVVGGLPPSVPSIAQNSVQSCEPHQIVAPKVFSSQSTIAMSSLTPSALMEPTSQWAVDSNKMTMQNRSVSEPDIGRIPRQDHVNSSNGVTSSNSEGKASVSKGLFRFSRFNLGSQILQKTVGLVLKSQQGRQAKLGEANRFYYDEKLKRWIEEGAEPPAEEASPPPPPTTAAFRNQTSDSSLKNAFNEVGPATDSSLESRSSTPSGSNAGFPSIPPLSNQFSAHGRTGVRSRYVDTFNKGGGTAATLLPTPSFPSAKPANLTGAKFFIPAAASSEQPSSEPIAGSMQEAFESDKTPLTPTNEPFERLSSSPSSTMPRFPSVGSIAEKGMTGNGSSSVSSLSRRTASWSGGHENAYSPLEIAKLNPSPLSIPQSDPSTNHLPMNGGNISDDLQEVEL